MKLTAFLRRWPALLPGLIFALVLLGVSSQASAQTAAWNENRVAWDAPTTCTSGQPISACPVTGYIVQRSAVSTGPYADLATVTTITYTHLNAAAGVNCYRVIATSATGNSGPSNVACKTNTQPAGPPNPPSNLRHVAAVVSGISHSPVYGVLASGGRSSTVAGFAAVGTLCDGPVLFRYRNRDYQKPATFTPWSTSASASVAAPCVNAS